MNEPKPIYNTKGNGRKLKVGRFRFSAADVLKQARGLPTPEGYVVITKDFTDFLQEELARLFEMEDLLKHHAAELSVGVSNGDTIPELMKLCHIDIDEAGYRETFNDAANEDPNL